MSSQDSLPQPAIIRLSLDGPHTLLVVNPLSTSSTRLVVVTIDTFSVTVIALSLSLFYITSVYWLLGDR